METLQPIVGHTITRLMQTQSRSAGVILEEFGEAYWIELVAELEDGRAIQIDEYDWSVFEGRLDQCIRAQLVQSDYSLSDIEGQRIQALLDPDGEFAVVLANGLCLSCPGAPGGNYPWVYKKNAHEHDG